MFKKISSSILTILSVFSLNIPMAIAAAPDGFGPWADTVTQAAQGLRKDGSAVLATRSDPTAALGVAEDNTTEGNFYSLGFGGVLTLGFQNGISSGAFVVEATNNPYPDEKVNVEVSEDGVTYYPAGTITEDGSVALPSQIACGKYVRLTDISDKALYEPTADAYDVDGVQAQGLACSTTGRMTGGGSVFTANGTRVTHGFQLRCNTTDDPQSLEINWGKGNKFHLESLTSAFCTDDPIIDQGNPKATFDTYIGSGVGRFNGIHDYTAEWTFVDAGEPGKNDLAKIVIKDPSNVVILTAEGKIDKGNQQAHD